LDVWGDHLGIEGLELIVSLGCCLDATVDQIEGNETAYGFKKKLFLAFTLSKWKRWRVNFLGQSRQYAGLRQSIICMCLFT
jgi:hypothetical protein